MRDSVVTVHQVGDKDSLRVVISSGERSVSALMSACAGNKGKHKFLHFPGTLRPYINRVWRDLVP